MSRINFLCQELKSQLRSQKFVDKIRLLHRVTRVKPMYLPVRIQRAERREKQSANINVSGAHTMNLGIEPTLVGDFYQIQGKIGAGSFGEIYMGK